jgi:predicted transposase YdaD
LRYIEAYLESEDPQALQQELALLATNEYKEAGVLIQYFEKKGLEQGIEQGLEQGLRRNAMDNARKMLEHGIEWKVVTDVTGIRPEDLES